jgi:hypothetical protein
VLPQLDQSNWANDNLSSMSRFPLILVFAAALLVLGACNKPGSSATEKVPDTYVSDPNSAGFDIEPLPDNGSAHQWLATYTAQGKTAKFRIELSQSVPLDDKESREFLVESGKGRLIAEPGSDASVLLADLKKALVAKTMPIKVQRANSLSFQFVSFGKNNSQAPGGGFNAKPPGNWTPMKLFIGKGDQEGQVFLNLNPVVRKGQFSIKDPDYGDIVLAQLARVL